MAVYSVPGLTRLILLVTDGIGEAEGFVPRKPGDQSFQKYIPLRDWSLIMGKGGLTKWEGVVESKVLVSKKRGGAGKVAMLKGGTKKFGSSFNMKA